ncbi:beta-carotene isomerase D27-like protein [Skeletonema marinoi]|uniref:Beta-carotene isomerase D27-like protein n=3 Tax=Skeletonema marinoi TaxID=267567 RepID=A0AAD8XXP2_9STRA|nr:beta-carotene isomerase D27-like protein [Skeletonema marinoi]
MSRRSALLIGAAALASASFTATAFSPSSCGLLVSTKRVTTKLAPRKTTLHSSLSNNDDDDVLNKLSAELKELAECSSLIYNYLSKPDKSVSAEDVVLACDAVDASSKLRQKSHEFGRYQLLVKLLKSDYDAYVTTAEFLSPSRIPRGELPNVQDVVYVPFTAAVNEDDATEDTTVDTNVVAVTAVTGEDGQPLVADCTLEELAYNDSPLDKLLLSIFRNLVTTHTGGVTSDIPGIKGLLAQGRQYMTMELPEGVTYEDHTKAQHTMVKNTLGGLMTPVLPPFYRIFMSGIVPKLGTDYDGKQIGPWFYAPWLTSMVTPTFFGFLVGPSKPNRRSDGQRGGLVVEKCKFLQESGCKGLCLHQCKLPAQEFFKEELGLSLTVKPNFVTQECQWSFGEEPVDVVEDDSFPKGCLVGCDSRKVMSGRKSTDVLCM